MDIGIMTIRTDRHSVCKLNNFTTALASIQIYFGVNNGGAKGYKQGVKHWIIKREGPGKGVLSQCGVLISTFSCFWSYLSNFGALFFTGVPFTLQGSTHVLIGKRS